MDLCAPRGEGGPSPLFPLLSADVRRCGLDPESSGRRSPSRRIARLKEARSGKFNPHKLHLEVQRGLSAGPNVYTGGFSSWQNRFSACARARIRACASPCACFQLAGQ